jgi:PAT family beta-lactamase induction signal transducer AmpG
MPAEASRSPEASPDRRSWSEAAAVYRRPQVISLLFLGFSAGLPYLLVFSTLATWLREDGVDVATIGFFSWVGITFSIKVLWAPLVDRLPLPFLSSWLGKRRAWMLIAQLGLVLGILAMALSDPARNIETVAVFAVFIAFASATQDIAIDAYRIEVAEVDLQGAMASTYILGYRLATLCAGAGALYAAEFLSWSWAYALMAALVAVGVVTTLVISRPPGNANNPDPQSHSITGITFATVYRPMLDAVADFFVRYGRQALLILVFIAVYRIADIVMGVMANPFYIDLGFSKTDIANVTKVFGFAMSIAGAFLGGVMVARYGVWRPLLLGGILTAGSNLLFAVLSGIGPDLAFLAVTVSADNLSAGLASSAFIAYLSSLTSRDFTATQYALFSSLMTLPGKFIGGYSGTLVAAQGYGDFFVYTAIAGVPAILMLVFLIRPHLRDAGR